MRVIALLFVALMLTACETTRAPINVAVTINPLENVTIEHPTPPRSVNMRSVEWHVITSETMNEYFNSSATVLYGINPSDYEDLALNLAELRRYILSLQANNEYYKQTIDRIQKLIKDDAAKRKQPQE